MTRMLVVLVLALLLAPASSAQAAHCRPHKHERVVARSSAAVVLSERVTEGDEYSWTTTEYLTGCSRRTGRRHIVGEPLESGDSYWTTRGRVHLAGTALAYSSTWGDKYLDSAEYLVVDDAVHDGRFGDTLWFYGAWTLHPSGSVFAIADSSALLRYRWDDGFRILDQGSGLADLRVGRRAIAWTHGGRWLSRSVRLGPTRCPRLTGHGTGELDVEKSRAPWIKVCRRATGVTVTVPSLVTGEDYAGDYALLATPGGLVRIDTTAGTAETIVGADVKAYAPRIDTAGSIAWLQPTDETTVELWVDDAAGRRPVATRPADPPTRLTRDGSTLRWGDVTFTLQPRAAS